MNQSKFAVTQFENRNGSTSWRVDGRLHGVRFRKNFKTREEAAAEKAALEIKALQTVAGLRQIATALNEEQVREAEALFQRVESRSRPLSFYVDFAFEHYREPEQQQSLTDVEEAALELIARQAASGPHAVATELSVVWIRPGLPPIFSL